MKLAVMLMFVLSGFAQQPSSTIEDPQLRARAVSLIERSIRLSSPIWPMNEEIFNFHIQNPVSGEAMDGSIRIGVGAANLKRWEITSGSYQFSQVQNMLEFATYKTGPEPAGVIMARKLAPVSLVRFDETDIIRAITDKTMDGVLASCIDFDTIKGSGRTSGSVCVDKEAGYLVYEKLDEMVVKQSAFFAFNNGFLPGHIERWTGSTEVISVDEKVTAKADFPPNYFDYPVGAKITHACNSFIPAYDDNTPQPRAKSQSDGVIDIVLHGFVGSDGKPTGLKVLDNAHSELVQEAISTVSNWTFHPAQCNYQPTSQQRDFVVHFQGWQ